MHKPTYEELEKRIAELEAALKNKENVEGEVKNDDQFLNRDTVAQDITKFTNDLFNFLFLIYNHAQLMKYKMDGNTNSSTRYLDQIVKACDHMQGNILSMMCKYNHSRNRKREFPASIQNIVQDAVEKLKTIFPDNIKINHNVQSDVQTLDFPLHKIIINLGKNVGGGMVQEGGIIELNLSDVEIESAMSSRYGDLKPGSYLCLSVKASGPGISPELLNEILFLPFYSTKKEFVGEGGLGFPVNIQSIIEKANGIIFTESTPDNGVVFKAYFNRKLI